MASSDRSECEPLTSENAASQYLQPLARKGTGGFGSDKQERYQETSKDRFSEKINYLAYP